MLKHCHKTAAGAVKNTVGLKARPQSNFIGQQGKMLKRKEEKKTTSTAGFFLPFSRSGVSKWSCRFYLLADCNTLPTASTFNTSNVTIKSLIQNMSDSITVREDEISCSPDPAWEDYLTICSKVTNHIH